MDAIPFYVGGLVDVLRARVGIGSVSCLWPASQNIGNAMMASLSVCACVEGGEGHIC